METEVKPKTKLRIEGYYTPPGGGERKYFTTSAETVSTPEELEALGITKEQENGSSS